MSGGNSSRCEGSAFAGCQPCCSWPPPNLVNTALHRPVDRQDTRVSGGTESSSSGAPATTPHLCQEGSLGTAGWLSCSSRADRGWPVEEAVSRGTATIGPGGCSA